MTIKITRKLLDSYRRIKREIPILEAEIEGLAHTDAGIGNSVIMDYREGYPRPQSVVGRDMELYERRKAELRKKQEKVKAVEDWINAIEDGQTRCVFRMRYIDGMCWTKIAEKTGYVKSPDYPRIVLRDRYLKKCGIK